MHLLVVTLCIAFFTVGCASSREACTPAAPRVAALLRLRDADWQAFHETELSSVWPYRLSREMSASASDSAGVPIPIAVFARLERSDGQACECCDLIEFTGKGNELPHLESITLHLVAPDRTSAIRLAQELVTAGIPPSQAPDPLDDRWLFSGERLPWETTYSWQLRDSLERPILLGIAEAQIDRVNGRLVVFIRHSRIDPGR